MRFKKVIVMNPPSPPGYVSNKDSMGGFGHLFPSGATLMPPLDLVYLASYLAEKKIPVDVLESLGLELTKEQLVNKITSASSDQPDQDGSLLIIMRTSAPTLDWDLSLCGEIKALTPFVRIGIYGAVVPHVVGRIQREGCIDYLVKGEPDETVYELMLNHTEKDIPGLVFKSNGKWIENQDRDFIKELDELPFPKWEMFPYEKYTLPKSATTSEVAFLPMLSSRGCPVGCHYCPYPVGQGLLFRLRSPMNVVDEIEHLVSDLGIQHILFRDPIFSLNQNRVIQICEEIMRRKLRFSWRCETRVDCLRDETLEVMAKAGCIGINFGVESAEVEIQANVGRKPITQEQFIHTIDLCHQLGVKTFGFFIIGLPGDTVDTILNTVKFAIDMQANLVQFTAASPFLGTKLREWAISRELTTEDEYAYINSFSVKMGNENLSEEQVKSLVRFAQFLGAYFINRKGFLKDDTRPGAVYQATKSLADWFSIRAARATFALGKWHFERRFNQAV